MSWSIGLHVSNAQIEFVAKNKSDIKKKRLFYNHGGLESSLKQIFDEAFLDNKNVAQLNIHSSAPLQILEAQHGQPIALITTLGFESWLEPSLPTKNSHFCLKPDRQPGALNSDFIFGVAERTNASGHIEKLIQEDDLAIVLSKIKLHGIESVAICLINSNKNPENENRIAKFLSDNNIQSFKSSDLENNNQKDLIRFWRTIWNAYAFKETKEHLQIIDKVIKPFVTQSTSIELTGRPWDKSIEAPTPCLYSISTIRKLIDLYAKSAPILYCGLDEFLLLSSDPQNLFNQSSYPYNILSPNNFIYRTKLQPLTALDRGYFSEISFSENKLNLEPGPVVWGRGLSPTFLDLLTTLKEFPMLSGFHEKISEKGQQRLREQLSAYARNMSEESPIEAIDLAKKMCAYGISNIRDELATLTPIDNLQLVGPLSPIFKSKFGNMVSSDEFFMAHTLLAEILE